MRNSSLDDLAETKMLVLSLSLGGREVVHLTGSLRLSFSLHCQFMHKPWFISPEFLSPASFGFFGLFFFLFACKCPTLFQKECETFSKKHSTLGDKAPVSEEALGWLTWWGEVKGGACLANLFGKFGKSLAQSISAAAWPPGMTCYCPVRGGLQRNSHVESRNTAIPRSETRKASLLRAHKKTMLFKMVNNSLTGSLQ